MNVVLLMIKSFRHSAQQNVASVPITQAKGPQGEQFYLGDLLLNS